MLMLMAYIVYTVFMYFNTSIERWAMSVQKSVMKKIYPSASESGSVSPRIPPANESTPLHNTDKGTQVSGLPLLRNTISDHITPSPPSTSLSLVQGNEVLL